MKVGLVLEGGAMRGMYTAGVIDTFLSHNIKVDGIIGVSAGALFGVNYFSKQKGRVIRINKRFCRDLRYMSLPSLLFTGNVVNKKFTYYKVNTKLDVFDDEEFEKNNTGYYVVVTNIKTGKPEYLPIDKALTNLEKFRASAAMPLVSKIVKIDGKEYLDGGVSDAIPIDKCIELGYDKIIVVLTQHLEYRKKPLSEKKKQKIYIKYKNYPNLISTMVNRYKNYNNTVEKIIDLENKKEIFVIRPSRKIVINVIERHKEKLQEVYDLGVEDCNKVIDDLLKYLNS